MVMVQSFRGFGLRSQRLVVMVVLFHALEVTHGTHTRHGMRKPSGTMGLQIES